MTWRQIMNRLGRKLLFAATNNIGLKLGSVLLALILWITITGQGTADRILRDIPYQIRDIPEDMVLTDKGIGTVNLRLRGPKSLIPTLKPEDCSVVLRLPPDAAEGETVMEITHSNVVIPYSNQMSILQITPTSIRLTLDAVITKTVQIQPLLRGAPNPDFQLGQWRVTPPEALLRGPSKVLESMTTVLSEPIDISDQTLSFNERVSLKPGSPLVTVVRPTKVSTRIEILERITERSFPEFEITVVPDVKDSGMVVTPLVVTLTITGPAATLNRLKPTEIQLVADCTGLGPGDHDLKPVLVSNLEKIVSVLVDPDTIQVSIPNPTPAPEKSPMTSAP
ncbi:YbbR-like domain-containing protein [bacterium]|nr:YbbR-like domain-containing protein [candidate division CSSED10-310 bacterium]